MADNQEKFNIYKDKYPVFKFNGYEIMQDDEKITLAYKFEIDGLVKFTPNIKIMRSGMPMKDISKDESFKAIAFNIGLIELISYWKSTCSPNIIIECGSISEGQVEWFKKLYYYGLGEFFYTNSINTSMQEFVKISSTNNEKHRFSCVGNKLDGVLIPIGGGKDSCVTMELLKDVTKKYCIMVNPKEVSHVCSKIAGFNKRKYCNCGKAD